jgi:sigma-E processing peptidase SpoIIGA
LKNFFFARQKLLYPVTLIDEDMEIHMTALLDTGNGLIEPISKKPVCLVGKNVFEENRAKEGGRKEFQPQKFRVIPYHSVGKENGILSGYEMDRLIIDTDERKVIIEKPMIGISDVPVSGNDSYQMILQPELLREGVN